MPLNFGTFVIRTVLFINYMELFVDSYSEARATCDISAPRKNRKNNFILRVYENEM